MSRFQLLYQNKHKTILRAALIGLLSISLVACSSDDEAEYVERPVEELYNEALDLLAAEEFTLSAQTFEEVDRQHPYSAWATKAQLMSAYVHYLRDRYDESIIALDRYIELHPGSPDTAYAYYLKAINYYEQITDVGRDQKITALALDSLTDVVTRYPKSPYAKDARLKIDLTRDHLAGKEMEIGRFYQKRDEHLASINRYKLVLARFQTTTHVPEALHRLVENYISLGIREEAQAAAAVLGHNFPGSQWYSLSYDLLDGAGLEPKRKSDSIYEEIWNWVF